MNENSQVSVIGLGDMGSAIARAFMAAGLRTTVWNRSEARIAPLTDAGATAAATAGDAVTASPLIVICVLDGTAVDEVLRAVEPSLAGKVVVNLTSGSPQQARTNEARVRARGGTFLDGGIMADPPYIGTSDALITLSGDRIAFEAHQATLDVLGSITYCGEDAGHAAVEFLAQVAVGYEFLIGLLHTFKLVQDEGIDVAKFAERVSGSVGGYAPLVDGFGTAVASRTYAPDLGPLTVQAALMDDLISHRESVGVDTTRMREVRELMNRRIADGHGDHGFSSLFELLGVNAADLTRG